MKFYKVFTCIYLLAGLILTACGNDDATLAALNSQAAKQFTTPTPNTTVATSTATQAAATTVATATPVPKATTSSGFERVMVSLNLAATGPAISPYIYGMAGTDAKDPNYVSDLRLPFTRWGGNPSTRFNWVMGNAWNTGRDGGFTNTDYGNANTDVASSFAASVKKEGIAALLTIPTIGWVAKNTDNNVKSLNVPGHGGVPLTTNPDAILGYDPTANRQLTSVQSLPRKNAPFVLKPDPNSSVIYQDEWVNSLVSRFGNAANGGIKFYAMDNEPDLWAEEHTDVHPADLSYADTLKEFTDYASAVKAVDSTAQITGPVVSGWLGYMYSALDRSTDNFKAAADRKAHNDMPFLAWFLQQMHDYETQHGQRLLDVLDVHYYPETEGLYKGATDAQSNAARLRATRSLWDRRYVDESWIDTQIYLIPRLQDWINTYYPGTKIGISEWNFGADTTVNGALAIAQTLGIFGSNNVYFAAYWINPPSQSPGYYAFKIYTNFDSNGDTFGDTSIPVQVSNDQLASSYAAMDSKTGHLHIMLINPKPNDAQPITVQLVQTLPAQSVKVYEVSTETQGKLVAQKSVYIPSTNNFEYSLPPYSITLLDIQPPSTK